MNSMQLAKVETMHEEIRDQITRQDILQAIAALDRGEPHAFGPSTFYDLLEGERRYPPKAVVGLAARRALGRPLQPDEFSGGQESWAFRLLRDRGFTVVDKERRSDRHDFPGVPSIRVFIEDTKTAIHGHGGPGWEFGSCLWSPSSYKNGSDHYALMREPETDDLVIHINDGDVVGWSYVSAPFRELTDGPPSPGKYAGRSSYYRVDLKDYREFPRSVPLTEFVDRNRAAIEEELKEDEPKRYPFILYGNERAVRHAEGAYLTRCTPKLYELIRMSVFASAPTTLLAEEPPAIFNSVDGTWGQRAGVQERVGKKIEISIPNETIRCDALSLLALAIETADEERGSAWYLRETTHGLRLMTGRLRALSVTRSKMRVSVIGPVGQDVRDALGADIEDDSEFKFVPGSLILTFPVAQATKALGLLKQGLISFIEMAMARVRRSVSLEDHDPEAVAYISSVLGRQLPQPVPAQDAEQFDVDEDDASASHEPRIRGRAPIFERGERSIVSLMSDIERGIIALPDLQRPFVWEDTAVRQLLNSLFVGFPVGTLVFWHTSKAKQARVLGTDRPGLQATDLVIDGQQRLTALFAVMRGVEITGKEGGRRKISIAFRPRDGRFEVADAPIRNDPEFLPNVTELWDGKRLPVEIKRDLFKRLREKGRMVDSRYEDAVDQNLGRAHAISDFRFPTLDIRETAVARGAEVTDEDVADIFVRINSQGTRLGQADFVLTLLSVYHGELRDRIEERARQMSQGAVIAIDAQQLLRIVCGVAFGRARMSAVYRFLRGVDPITGEADTAERVKRLKSTRRHGKGVHRAIAVA